jgi:hypothetical protein
MLISRNLNSAPPASVDRGHSRKLRGQLSRNPADGVSAVRARAADRHEPPLPSSRSRRALPSVRLPVDELFVDARAFSPLYNSTVGYLSVRGDHSIWPWKRETSGSYA